MVKVQGQFLELTVFGYFRKGFMVLHNEELYLYEFKDAPSHKKLIVLTPGVVVKSQQAVPENLKKNSKFKGIIGSNEAAGDGSPRRIFPIDIIVGGAAGNIGIVNRANFSVGLVPSTISLFFDDEDV